MRDTGDLLIQRIADLETQNQMLEAFAGAVAHNLKGLLYHITGYARTLRDVHGVLSDAELHECLELMHNKARETLEMMDDLLFLSGADPDTMVMAVGKNGQVSKSALEGVILAQEIGVRDGPSESGWVAAETQEANHENGDARSYRAQARSAESGAGRERYTAPRNGDRPACERHA